MVHALFMNAQTPNECATPEPTGSDPAGVYSGAIDLESLDTSSCEPIVFNIFSWGINKADGTQLNLPLAEEHCLTTVANLNILTNVFISF